MLFVVSVQLANVPSVHYRLLHRQQLKSTRSSRVSTSTPHSPVHVSKNCARISSVAPSSPSRRFSVMPRSTSRTSTRLSSSVVLPVSHVSSSSYRTSSTARSPTSRSTPMRPSHTVLQSRQPFLPVIPPRRLRISSCSMLHRSLLVSRLQEV